MPRAPRRILAVVAALALLAPWAFAAAPPDPCAPLVGGVQPCAPPEERAHDEEVRQQVDEHADAALRVDAAMATAQFDFHAPALIFDSQAEGASCTTWRFTGDPEGSLALRMTQGNGLSGEALVSGGAAESQGTVARERWTDVRAFGVILAESAHERSDPAPSDPMDAYSFNASPSATWALNASGLTGDFTRCTTSQGGLATEHFTYAALPDDVAAETPSFSGSGIAASARVSFNGAIDHPTSRPLTAALVAPAAPEAFVLARGGLVVVHAEYADGLASTKVGFTQLAGRDGGPSHRFEAGATCTEWDGDFTEVLVEATTKARAGNASLAVTGFDAATPGAFALRDAPGFTADLQGPPGGIRGSLLVCDNPSGPGSATFTGTVHALAPAPAGLVVVRVTPEGSP